MFPHGQIKVMNEYVSFRIQLTKLTLLFILFVVFLLNAIRLSNLLSVISDQDIEENIPDQYIRLYIYYYATLYIVWTPMALLGLFAIAFEQFKLVAALSTIQVLAVLTKLVIYFWPDVGIHFGIILLEFILMMFLIYFCYLLKLSRRVISSSAVELT